jgi:hypothetical protein
MTQIATHTCPKLTAEAQPRTELRQCREAAARCSTRKILSTRTSGHCVTAITSRDRGREYTFAHGKHCGEGFMPGLPKRAISNEIRHPYIVEVAIVGDELNVQLGRRIMQFHQSQRIQPRYGRTITTNRGKLYRWCFFDLLIARAFIEQFGGAFCKPSV